LSTTARHAQPAASFVFVLFRLLKRIFTRQRPPSTPIGELLVEEFTTTQVANMDANSRKAMWAIAIIALSSIVILTIYMVGVQHFVDSEIGPMFDSLMKPLPGTPR